MDDLVTVDPNAIGLTAGMRPRPGAQSDAAGKFKPEDMEIAVAIAVGCSKPSGLLARDGKRQGQMVPVVVFSRPLGEFIAEAKMRLNGQEIGRQAKQDGET